MNNRFTTSRNIDIPNSHIYGGVDYQSEINSNDDLTIGGAFGATVSFKTDMNNFSVGDTLTWYCEMENTTEKQMGVFYIKEITRDRDKYKILAADAMNKFDVRLDSWLKQSWENKSVASLYSELLSEVHVTGASISGWTNSNYVIKQNYFEPSMSGRDVLIAICETIGANAYIGVDGKLAFSRYGLNEPSTFVTIDNSQYKHLEFKDYNSPVIDKLQVIAIDGDVGEVRGTGDNAYKIISNPILVNDSTTTFQTAVTNLYNAIHAIHSYRPLKIELFTDFGLKVGDTFKVNFRDTIYTAYVFKKSISNKGVTIECTGNEHRPDDVVYLDAGEKRIKGNYNILKRDVDETKSIVGTFDGRITTVEQTAEGLTVRVEDAEEQVATLDAKVDAIEIKVEGVAKIYRQDVAPSASIGDIWYCTDEESDYYGKWWRYDGEEWQSCADPQVETNTAAISVERGRITAEVTRATGVENTLSGQIVTIDNNKVSFTDLSTQGSTTINGANITTGTISANRINGNGLNVSNATIGNCTINNQCTVNGTLYGPINITSGGNDILKTGQGDSGLGIKVHEIVCYGDITSNYGDIYGGDFVNNLDNTFGYPGAENNTSLKNVITYLKEHGGGGEPAQYIKNASVSGNTLTLTKKDGSTVTFTKSSTAVFG